MDNTHSDALVEHWVSRSLLDIGDRSTLSDLCRTLELSIAGTMTADDMTGLTGQKALSRHWDGPIDGWREEVSLSVYGDGAHVNHQLFSDPYAEPDSGGVAETVIRRAMKRFRALAKASRGGGVPRRSGTLSTYSAQGQAPVTIGRYRQRSMGNLLGSDVLQTQLHVVLTGV